MCKQGTVCPGKRGVKAGSALAHPGQCYSSGQGFPGRVSAVGTEPLSRLIMTGSCLQDGILLPGPVLGSVQARLDRAGTTWSSGRWQRVGLDEL